MNSALLNHVKKLKEFAEESASYAASNPDNMLAMIIAKNNQQAADEAEKSYFLKEREQKGAIVDLRFIGQQANGSMLLDDFIKIFTPLSRAVKRVAYNLLTNNDTRKRTPPEISDFLNLRLTDIQHGSTHILLSGSIEKDMTEQSIFFDSMEEIFNLLESSNENIREHVETIGDSSAKSIHDMLSATKSSGMTVEIGWQSGCGLRKWKGTLDNMERLMLLLNDFTVEQEYKETISGIVQSINRQSIRLKGEDDTYIIKYNPKTLSEAQKLRIMSGAKLKVQTKKYFNESTEDYAFDRKLISLA